MNLLRLLVEAFKSARKIELFAIIAAICILSMIWIADTMNFESSKTEDELRMQQILSKIEGAGKVDVMLVADEQGKAQGAVIASAGAGEVHVLLSLQQAVHTLTGLELNQIEVLKSKR